MVAYFLRVGLRGNKLLKFIRVLIRFDILVCDAFHERVFNLPPILRVVDTAQPFRDIVDNHFDFFVVVGNSLQDQVTKHISIVGHTVPSRFRGYRRMVQRPQPAQRRLLVQVGGNRHHAPLALIADLGRLARRIWLFGRIGRVRDGLRACLARHGEIGRHQLHPPLHHAVALGEKPVAADVHAVSLVADRPRDAADLLARLQNYRHNLRAPQQFQPGRQPCRPSPNNDRLLCHPSPCSLNLGSQMSLAG